jgi:hypothetical protein
MIAAEITAAIDAAGTLSTFYVSDDGFTSAPTDTPADKSFTARIVELPTIALNAYSDGRTGGATKLGTGRIGLANVDGGLDSWANYSFDGRPFVARTGLKTAAYPAGFNVLLAGTMESVDVTSDRVTVELRDKQFVLDRSIRATALYGGTNALPAGLDGVPTDIKGRARPKAYGQVLGVSPPMVNTSRYILEMGICLTVDALRSNGVVLTQGAAYVSQVDMETNAPAAGQYRVWAAGGYLRLGSFAGEQITVDLSQGTNAAARTVAQILKQLALDAGVSAGDISAADVTALDALNSSVVGVWVSGASDTYLQTMDAIAASVGAFYGFDWAGVLRMGRLSAPTGASAVLTVNEWDLLREVERRAPRDNGVPIWSATVNYAKNWTVQTTGLAGATTATDRGSAGQEYRGEPATDSSIKTQWLMAGVTEVNTLLIQQAAAATEAARLLALYKVKRDIFEVTINIDKFTSSGVRMMDEVLCILPRFGMSAGRYFRLIGTAIDDRTVTLSLWG